MYNFPWESCMLKVNPVLEYVKIMFKNDFSVNRVEEMNIYLKFQRNGEL